MNIFVAKLNYDTSSETLEDTFAAYGDVDSAKVIFDRDTNRSKGFGFVEMPNDDDALMAIEQLNESTLEGRTIVVKKARPRESGGGGGGSRGGW